MIWVSLALAVATSLGAVATSAPAFSASERSLPLKLAQSICSYGIDFKQFWAAGVYDVQIEGARLTFEKGQLSSGDLKKRALALAQKKNFHGYSYGSCSAKSAWIAAFPAARTIEITGRKLKISELHGCTQPLRGYWTKSRTGTSTPLVERLGEFEVPAGESGFFSFECDEKMDGGPSQEFYLGPFGKPDMSSPVAISMSIGTPDQRVASWLQEVREHEKLPHLKSNNDLMSAAKSLGSRLEVQHDGKAIETWTTALRAKKIVLLGENRVRGETLEESLFLLWASPRHRDLILNKSALTYGIEVVSSKTGVFIVMLFGYYYL